MTVTITATPSTSLLTDLASLNHPTDLTLINPRELPDLDYLGMLSAATQALCQAVWRLPQITTRGPRKNSAAHFLP